MYHHVFTMFRCFPIKTSLLSHSKLHHWPSHWCVAVASLFGFAQVGSQTRKPTGLIPQENGPKHHRNLIFYSFGANASLVVGTCWNETLRVFPFPMVVPGLISSQVFWLEEIRKDLSLRCPNHLDTLLIPPCLTMIYKDYIHNR